MTTDDETKSTDPRKVIADANKMLARLQRDRLGTLTRHCLIAYRSLQPRHPTQDSPFVVDSALMESLAEALQDDDVVDAARVDELDRAAESFAQQLRLYRKGIQKEFDVFLCHNADDKREVRSIAAQLRRRGFLPWLDDEQIRPGVSWQSKIQDDLETVRSCAVIVGRSGVGPWQKREVDAVLQLFVERHLPVIPVLLPSCADVPELPMFLRSLAWVDYRTLDPDPFEQLVWGISQRRPAI